MPPSSPRGAGVPRARRRAGRVERAVSVSIRAARTAGADPRLAAAEALARTLARALDDAASTGQIYALAPLSARLWPILDAFAMTPAPPAPPEDDELAALLADLATPD